jgi:hypothetical protein
LLKKNKESYGPKNYHMADKTNQSFKKLWAQITYYLAVRAR